MSNNFSIFDVCPQRITSINKPICYLEDLGYVINSQIILECNFDSKVVCSRTNEFYMLYKYHMLFRLRLVTSIYTRICSKSKCRDYRIATL